MSSLRVCALVALVVTCILAVEARPPSRTCRICEDVIQTYHDVYQCAGHDVDLWGAGDDPLIPACEEPKFACSKISGDLAEACTSMETSFYEDDSLARTLWMSQMEFGNHYDTCVKLEKCENDPNPEEKEYSPCHQVFLSHDGKHNIMAPGFTSNCTEECYLCNWLVKEWPLFQEICVPDGTQMPNSIDPDRDVQKQSGLESLGKLDKAKADHEAEIQAFENEAEAEEAAANAAPAEGGDAEAAAPAEGEEQAAFIAREFTRYPESTQADPGADEQLMAASHQQWEASSPYEGASFLETGTKVKLNSAQRMWSRTTNAAIHGVLQRQAGSAAPAKVPTAANKGLHQSAFDQVEAEDDAVEAGPVIGGTDLKSDCFSMWRYFVRSRKAKFFASWKHQIGIEITPADMERSNLWDANIACKCLGHCGLDAFEHLGLIKQCRYDERDRTMMEYAFQTPH